MSRSATGVLLLGLFLAVFVAYLPALHGGMLWDDDAHMTPPALRSVDGLGRIWFEIGASQQYYPLLHSAFWLQHRVWGDWTTGYHAVSIAAHALNAWLVFLILSRLLAERGGEWGTSAAALAAGVFAMHPVHAESVAWITEQKNTLSGACYLGAMLAYLRFDERRARGLYLLALALFIMGLLTKTVTATLPAALLVVFWWKRGGLSWKRDVAPLIPFFALGAAGGLFTAWVEHHIIGAKGTAFDLTFAERFLLAGRVVWFYLGKIIWPTDLMFIYPRWTIDSASPAQWLFPVTLGATLVALLWWSRRRRAPLACALFFGGTLFPVLGFFNVYPFLFSYVADHFQYLASLGVITLACGCVATVAARAGMTGFRALPLALIPIVLGVLTHRQSAMYADAETLYRATLAANPGCWMAENNLGVLLRARGETDEAIACYRRALSLRPEYPEAHNNLGAALHALGRHDEAIISLREAMRLRPAYPECLGNLAAAQTSLGRPREAIETLRGALAFDPENAGLRFNLGVALESAGRGAEALAEYRKAAASEPENARFRTGLARLEAGALPRERAVEAYRALLKENPDDSSAHFALAVLLADQGRLDEARLHYESAARLNPSSVEARNNLGSLLLRTGHSTEALPHLEAAARLKPDDFRVAANWARALEAAGRLADAANAAEQALNAARAGGDAAAEKISAWMIELRTRAGSPNGP